MEQETNPAGELPGDLHTENEILRLQIRARFGDAFAGDDVTDLPPDIENQFLKNLMTGGALEPVESFTPLYKRLGNPAVRSLSDLDVASLRIELRRLLHLLTKNEVQLVINDGPYPDADIYRFITEELFAQQVEKKPVPGLPITFQYETFHPNHRAEILKRTHSFLQHWLARSFDEYSTELSWRCISPDGKKYTREDLADHMQLLFESFQKFTNGVYKIEEVLITEEDEWKGKAVGTIKYDAVMPNGESHHYNGPCSLHLHLHEGWWSIYFFEMPGFSW